MEIGYGNLERLLIELFGLSETQRGALLGRFKYLQRIGGYGATLTGRGRASYAIDDILQIVLIFELIDSGCSPTHAVRIVQSYWDRARVNLAYAWSEIRAAPNGPLSEQLLWTVIPSLLTELGAGNGMLGVSLDENPGETTLGEILAWRTGKGPAAKRHAIVVHLPSLLTALHEAIAVVAPAQSEALTTALDRFARDCGVALPG
ncbi:MAG: hypothetical protein ABGW87_12380 [Sphingomonadaceae bacterium]